MFARTCATNADEGEAISSSLQELGFTPYASVVHSLDAYSVTLASSFANRFVLIHMTLCYFLN